jgi:hypothetical protein
MAEFSRPQSGLAPADGDDSGAYIANQWAPVLIAANRSSGMMVTGAAAPPGLPATQLVPNIGVFYATADRLAVTSPGASQISIATGASLVDGRLHTNDTAHTAVAITNPAANPRIDRVVVRQNYTVADFTSVNAPALIVDFNTARIAIISGAEAGAPVAPALTQDEDRLTYWDIPLAQYQIAVGGAISNLTDEREWVDAEMKTMFIPPRVGRDETGGADIAVVTRAGGAGVYTDTPQIILPDAVISYGSGSIILPQDFISTLTIRGMVTPAANGNIYTRTLVKYGACGDAGATSENSGFQIIALTTAPPAFACINSYAPSAPAADDFFVALFERDAIDANDTIVGEVWFLGFIATYLGWGRR